jgi:RNA polymerase sigma-70 factor, ECF subfamily
MPLGGDEEEDRDDKGRANVNDDTISGEFASPEADRSGGGSSSSTCSGLINLVRARDPDAWQRLVRLYTPLVYRWCRCAGVAADDARDVVQEVFTSVMHSLDDFQDTGRSGSFRAWLRGITRHRVLDHFRRRQSAPLAQGGTGAQAALLQIPAPADPLDTGNERDIEDCLWHRALELVRAEFTDRTWQAFWLAGVERRVPADVANDLQMTVDAVYQAKSRVLRRLRQELAGLEPP